MATIYINYATEYDDVPSQVSVSVTDGESFTFTEEHLPTLTADGYQFDGWLFAGSLISAGYVITEIDDDIGFTLIARWSKDRIVYGNASGGFGMPKTYVLMDENGNELIGIIVGEETVFTATAADISKGKIAGVENGVVIGTHEC